MTRYMLEALEYPGGMKVGVNQTFEASAVGKILVVSVSPDLFVGQELAEALSETGRAAGFERVLIVAGKVQALHIAEANQEIIPQEGNQV